MSPPAHLRALSLRAGPAQHFGYPSQLDGLHATRVHDGGDLAERGHVSREALL